VRDGTNVIAYQWYVWQDILDTIFYSKWGKDPQDNTFFSYYLTSDKSCFQLMWLLENPTAETSSATGSTKRYPYVYGSKLWILTSTTNSPIQELTSIKANWYADLAWADAGTSFIPHIRDGDSTAFSWTTLIQLLSSQSCRISSGWWGTWWRALDPNCGIDDIVVWTQTWAGCNSTLWNGFEWWKKDDGTNGTISGCYPLYNWTSNTTNCDASNPLLASNAKANIWFSGININGDSEYDTIWWKLYTWTNASSACPSGRHLPSDAEWTTLENTLAGTTCRTWDGWLCDGSGWKTNTSYTPDRRLTDTLKIPLAGYRLTDGSTFLNRGYNAILWSSTPSGGNAYYRYLLRNYSTVNRGNDTQSYGFSVRCMKD
jgi:uncharacterized protein (TIGR02145 family)